MDRIFVQIPSYRDRECQWTVKDLFDKAACPDRVFVGICWQFVPEEDQDCFAVPYPRPDQVRVIDYHARDAKGLGWARRQTQLLWRGEEYTLQIDSHMRFVPGWDEKMIAQQQSRGNHAVLTVYPPGYLPPDQREDWNRPQVQTAHRFHSNGVIEFGAHPVPENWVVEGPLSTAACAGGFIFGPGRIIEDVPADPDIYFFGEEPTLAARLWTHGYDLYSPSEAPIYHYYIRKDGTRPWNDDSRWHAKHEQSLRRFKALLAPGSLSRLDAPVDLGPYGLGQARTLADYQRFSGINFTGLTVAAYARRFPFVLDSATGDAPPVRQEVRPNPQAHLFILDHDGVIFSEEGGELIALNTAATYVWCALEEGWARREILDGLARLCVVDAATAEQQFDFLMDSLDGLGLLDNPSVAHLPSPPLECKTPGPAPAADQADHSLRRYRLLDSVLRVHYPTAESERLSHPPIAHLEIEPEGEADWEIEISHRAGVHSIHVNGRWLMDARIPGALAPSLKFALLRHAIARHDHSLHLHAGVVANGEHCLLLPAAKGSGKTTLVAGLVHAGYRYFSDEVALLDRATCKVRPFPLSLCVKQHGIAVFSSLSPDVAQLPVYEREDGEWVRYLTLPGTARAADQALPARHVVFPRYRPDCTTELHPISRIEALRRLLEQSTSIPKPLTLQDATAIVDWLRGVQSYELPFSELGQAVAQIVRLLPLPATAPA